MTDPLEEYRKLGIHINHDMDKATEVIIKALDGSHFSVSELDTEIPHRLRNRPTFGGMVIPWTASRDKYGKPLFAVVDEKKRIKSASDRLCGIDGKNLGYPVWFIGGPRSMSSNAFVDPPMHYECALYSLATCPYLRNAPGHVSTGSDTKTFERAAQRSKDPTMIVSMDLVKEGRPQMMGLCRAGNFRFEYIQRTPLDRPQYVYIATSITDYAWFEGVQS